MWIGRRIENRQRIVDEEWLYSLYLFDAFDGADAFYQLV